MKAHRASAVGGRCLGWPWEPVGGWGCSSRHGLRLRRCQRGEHRDRRPPRGHGAGKPGWVLMDGHPAIPSGFLLEAGKSRVHSRLGPVLARNRCREYGEHIVLLSVKCVRRVQRKRGLNSCLLLHRAGFHREEFCEYVVEQCVKPVRQVQSLALQISSCWLNATHRRGG